ncbi:hypothetical protein BaRGS_00035070 [Batillaria attramentaria]|uniref:Uncharacterized protein n=1 Tax=Batillaria attramentaria TaxID=370345 RepID=A0ABD0JFQ4_9CAEN
MTMENLEGVNLPNQVTDDGYAYCQRVAMPSKNRSSELRQALLSRRLKAIQGCMPFRRGNTVGLVAVGYKQRPRTDNVTTENQLQSGRYSNSHRAESGTPSVTSDPVRAVIRTGSLGDHCNLFVVR